ncbi:MAG TPA: exodeoxyribonuclease V subunit alpha [Acidimicrobiales bacterium]|nr:exodeoxyribonuclease V subunit alpha [Acidimicrobiales bacterium]
MTATLVQGALADAASAGVLASIDVHFAELLARRGGLADPDAILAAALCAKAVRLEHVCCVLDEAGVGLLWRGEDGLDVPAPPDPGALRRALAEATGVVEVVDEGASVDERGERPLVLSGPRAYLRRYALLEQVVADRLVAPQDLGVPEGTDWALLAHGMAADPEQRAAVRQALCAPVSVIAGGPGTGKTTAIALLLTVAADLVPPLTVALAAPTGKAASRLDEAVREAARHARDGTPGLGAPHALTLHALLGVGRDGIARRHGFLDADVVVIDEASMVSLPLLAETLRRARPETRVVLVGDPDQLASIEVGAVLSDVVSAAGGGGALVVSTLATSHRFGAGGGVAALAAAVREGSLRAVDEAVAAHETLARLEPDPGRVGVVDVVVRRAIELVEVARRGDAAGALDLVASLGVLCAHKQGDGSTAWWGRTVERRLVELGVLRRRDADVVGRPLLVTRNDPLTGLTNGMTGVVVAHDEGPHVAFELGTLPLAAVAFAEPAWALTIHKSQGSEFDEVVVSLPESTSELLTRELVYTAVTRARRAVSLLSPTGSLEAALARRVARASGLAARLRARGQSAAGGADAGRAANGSTAPAT